jgi:hypothetical protein
LELAFSRKEKFITLVLILFITFKASLIVIS